MAYVRRRVHTLAYVSQHVTGNVRTLLANTLKRHYNIIAYDDFHFSFPRNSRELRFNEPIRNGF